jgi:hypothetical protein
VPTFLPPRGTFCIAEIIAEASGQFQERFGHRHDRFQFGCELLNSSGPLPSKLNCEFLPPDRWKVEEKRRLVIAGSLEKH